MKCYIEHNHMFLVFEHSILPSVYKCDTQTIWRHGREYLPGFKAVGMQLLHSTFLANDLWHNNHDISSSLSFINNILICNTMLKVSAFKLLCLL